MQQSTYVRKLLEKIALDQKRPVADVEPFINVLEQNWFDTKEALRDLSDQDYQNFKIPTRIRTLIQQAVNQDEKQQQEEGWDILFTRLASQINEQGQFLKTCSIIQKILRNILENQLSLNFQKISKTSTTLVNNILNYSVAWDILVRLGFKVQGEFVVVNFNLQLSEPFNECLSYLQLILEPQEQFNPFKSNVSSVTGVTTTQIANNDGYDVYSFNEALERLKMKRFEIMSSRVDDREIILYEASQNQSIQSIQQQITDQDDFEDVQPHQDKALLSYIKQIAQTLEEQQFASKRKKEYQDLFSKPIYDRTVIRVKLQGDLMLEAKFAPLEQLQKLYDLLKDLIVEKDVQFYLYTAPPVQKMNAKYLVQTFEDLDSVPSGLFYLGQEKQQNYTIRPDIKRVSFR
ncbi:hypothetical protein pb186bvf_008186 [Paramecium bursaria]